MKVPALSAVFLVACALAGCAQNAPSQVALPRIEATCSADPGGECYAGPGGPLYAGPGGPRYAGPGGAAYTGPGGACYAGPGGPCRVRLDAKSQCPAICNPVADTLPATP